MRIADVSGRARAERLVVVRLALRIDAANVHLARLDAGALDALLAVAAVRVHVALRLDIHNGLAPPVRIRVGIRRTLAHDGPQRQRVQHSTLLVDRADVLYSARILTTATDARQLGRTIGIDAALGFR